MKRIVVVSAAVIAAGCSEQTQREFVPDPGSEAMAEVPAASAGMLTEAAFYPEGPVWLDDSLYFVERARDRVNVWRDGAMRVFYERSGCQPLGILALDDRLLLSCSAEGALLELDFAGMQLGLVRPNPDAPQWTNPNDFVADGRGGYYFTVSGELAPGAAADGAIMYRPAGRAMRMAAMGLRYPNGLASIDEGRTLLVAEQLENRIVAYDVDDRGALSGSRVFADLDAIAPMDSADPMLGPDGIELGPNGLVYVAQFGGGRVLKLDPQGGLVGSLEVAEGLYPTNLAIHDDRVWVTAVTDMSPEAGYPGVVVELADPDLAD